MHVAVDDRHRSEAAAAQAADRLDSEHAVGRGGVESDAQLALELLDEIVAAAQVARRTEAHLDDVLAGLLQLEEIVERNHAVNLRERHLEHIGDLNRNVARDVAVGLLHLVKDHDEGKI